MDAPPEYPTLANSFFVNISLQRGARFVVMVRVVQIKGVRMVLEHFVETLPPERKVCACTCK